MQPPIEETTQPEAPESAPDATPDVTPEAPPVETPAPDYATLTAPEGITVSDESLEAVREFAQAEGLSLETAQKLMSRDAQLVSNFERAGEEAMQAEVADWIAQSKKDPVIGGENFPRTERRAEELLSKYGPPGFYKRLKDNGFLYVPDFLSTLNALAAAAEEPRGHDVHGEPAPRVATDRDIFKNSKSMFTT